jgi:hypothetical protein
MTDEREPSTIDEPEDQSTAIPDTEVPPDVPEADAIEQATPTGPSEPDETPPSVGDAPEADALEQLLPAGDLDEDEHRG